MYECYMWSMPHVIYARHNEHDFLALRVRDNGLNIVKGGLDSLRKFSLASFNAIVCAQNPKFMLRIKEIYIFHNIISHTPDLFK